MCASSLMFPILHHHLYFIYCFIFSICSYRWQVGSGFIGWYSICWCCLCMLLSCAEWSVIDLWVSSSISFYFCVVIIIRGTTVCCSDTLASIVRNFLLQVSMLIYLITFSIFLLWDMFHILWLRQFEQNVLVGSIITQGHSHRSHLWSKNTRNVS